MAAINGRQNTIHNNKAASVKDRCRVSQSKRRHFSLQKTAFYKLKDGLSEAKRYHYDCQDVAEHKNTRSVY